MKLVSGILLIAGGLLVLSGGALLLGFISIPTSYLAQNSAASPISQQVDQTPEIEHKISSAQIGQDCQLTVSSDLGNKTITTNFDPNIAKCDQYTLTKLSDSGKYVAFEDLSVDGVDSLIKIYSYKLQKVTLLHDLDNFSILDFLFLPDDQLAVLISLGFKGEQKIYVYNLDYLFEQFLVEAQEGEFSDSSIKLATGELPIPNSTNRAATIKLQGRNLLVFNEDKTNSEPMLSFSLDTI